MGLEHHAVGMATSCAAMAKNAILQLEERSPHNGSGTKGLFKALGKQCATIWQSAEAESWKVLGTSCAGQSRLWLPWTSELMARL